MNRSTTLDEILNIIPNLHQHLSPLDPVYSFLKKLARAEIEKIFSNNSESIFFDMFGKINFPYFKMGNIDSLDLFNFDELIIFSFYNSNRLRYKNLLDIGGNIGLHSILMGKCGFFVTTYEPDTIHFNKLEANIRNNNLEDRVKLVKAAISREDGEANFTRVLGNTTGSHLTGSKKNPYGSLDEIIVKTESISRVLEDEKIDFIKIDAEGHETEILEAIPIMKWKNLEAMIEVGSLDNATKIYNFFAGTGVNLISQKTSWNIVQKLDEMPISHREGSLFITTHNYVPGITMP